jgi:integrase/recombinase XerD
MIESIFQLKWLVSRHKQAPLLEEREQFLARCQQQGPPQHGIRTDRRDPFASVGNAPPSLSGRNQTSCTGLGERTTIKSQSAELRESASYFVFVAKKFLRFHGKLRVPSQPRALFAEELDDFVSFMAAEQGLSRATKEAHRAAHHPPQLPLSSCVQASTSTRSALGSGTLPTETNVSLCDARQTPEACRTGWPRLSVT